MEQNSIEQKRTFLSEIFHSAPINKTTGLKLSYDRHGSAICTLPYNVQLNHGLGGIFGGILSSMMDLSGWFTVAPHYDSWLVTVEYSTRILEEVREVDLWSRGIIRKLGRTTAFADMEVYTKDEQLVAIGSGTFRLTTRPLKKVYD
jgi:uncharacterized protein (TIGR00369 family)